MGEKKFKAFFSIQWLVKLLQPSMPDEKSWRKFLTFFSKNKTIYVGKNLFEKKGVPLHNYNFNNTTILAKPYDRVQRLGTK